MSGEGSGGGLPVRPWYLPEGRIEGRGPWHDAETGAGASFRVPALDAGTAGELAGSIRKAATDVRRELPARRVIEAVSEAATRLADPASRWGEEARALLAAELGWPETLAGETLERMSETWTADALAGLVDEELGGPGVLDGFQPAPGPDGGDRRRRAAGPPLLLQVQAGNVPGVGVTGVIRALLVRSGVVARPSRAEPGLAALFARSLAAVSTELGRTLAVTWWPRDADAWEAVVKRSSKVILYGGGAAVDAFRRRVPAETDLVTYGPKLGLAVLLPDARIGDATRALARDVCAYEQRGCVSPRVAFVPEDRREEAARTLDESLGEYVKQNEVAPLSPAEASTLREQRARLEFGEDGTGTRLVGDPGELRWTVLTGPEPSVRSEALPRVVRVFGYPDPDRVASWLGVVGPRAQAVGYAGREGLGRLAEAAAEAGVSRVAPLGRLAWPPSDWRHDGRHQLLPLIRWCDWELGGP